MNCQVCLQSRGDISRLKYCGVWECVLARYWWAFCRAAFISINSTRLPWKRTSLKEPGHLGINKNRRFHSQWVFLAFAAFQSHAHMHTYRCLSVSTPMNSLFYSVQYKCGFPQSVSQTEICFENINIWSSCNCVNVWESERWIKTEMFVLHSVDNRLTYFHNRRTKQP